MSQLDQQPILRLINSDYLPGFNREQRRMMRRLVGRQNGATKLLHLLEFIAAWDPDGHDKVDGAGWVSARYLDRMLGSEHYPEIRNALWVCVQRIRRKGVGDAYHARYQLDSVTLDGIVRLVDVLVAQIGKETRPDHISTCLVRRSRVEEVMNAPGTPVLERIRLRRILGDAVPFDGERFIHVDRLRYTDDHPNGRLFTMDSMSSFQQMSRRVRNAVLDDPWNIFVDFEACFAALLAEFGDHDAICTYIAEKKRCRSAVARHYGLRPPGPGKTEEDAAKQVITAVLMGASTEGPALRGTEERPDKGKLQGWEGAEHLPFLLELQESAREARRDLFAAISTRWPHLKELVGWSGQLESAACQVLERELMRALEEVLLGLGFRLALYLFDGAVFQTVTGLPAVPPTAEYIAGRLLDKTDIVAPIDVKLAGAPTTFGSAPAVSA